MQPWIDRYQEEGGGGCEVRIEFVDIEGDSGLRERFGVRIPVVEYEGRILFEGRPDISEVEAGLQSMVGI